MNDALIIGIAVSVGMVGYLCGLFHALYWVKKATEDVE